MEALKEPVSTLLAREEIAYNAAVAKVAPSLSLSQSLCLSLSLSLTHTLCLSLCLSL